jgi:hypothetical protein
MKYHPSQANELPLEGLMPRDTASNESSIPLECIPAFVVSGRGIAASLRAEDVSLINEMHNLRVIDGSLNLLSKAPIYLDPDAAFLRGAWHFFWYAAIGDVPVIVNRWKSDCPAHVFEVFSDRHLRSALKLRENSQVILKIPKTCIDHKRTSAFRFRAAWYLLWRGRERMIYRDGWYMSVTTSALRKPFFWRAYQ